MAFLLKHRARELCPCDNFSNQSNFKIMRASLIHENVKSGNAMIWKWDKLRRVYEAIVDKLASLYSGKLKDKLFLPINKILTLK